MKTLKFNLENNTSRVLNAVNNTIKSLDSSVLAGASDLFVAESCVAKRHLSEPDCNKVKGLVQVKMKENAFEQLVSKFKNECKHDGVEVEDNFKWVTLEDGKRIRVLEAGKEFKIKWSSWCVSREFGEHREVCKSTVKSTLGQVCGQMWTKDEEAINVWAKENALSFVGEVKRALMESFDKKFNKLPFGVMWNSPRVDFSNPNDEEKSFKKVVLLREEDNCVMEIDVWGFCEETFEHNNDLFLISEKLNPTADVKKNRDLIEAGVILPSGLVTSADLLDIAQQVNEAKKFKKAWGDLMDCCNNVEDLLKLLRNEFTFGFDVEVVENVEMTVLGPQHLAANSAKHHTMQKQFGIINLKMDELILKKLNNNDVRFKANGELFELFIDDEGDMGLTHFGRNENAWSLGSVTRKCDNEFAETLKKGGIQQRAHLIGNLVSRIRGCEMSENNQLRVRLGLQVPVI